MSTTYPPHIRRHIEALQQFVRLNNIPGLVIPARGESQQVRPAQGDEVKVCKPSKGRWTWNSRLQKYELVIRGVYTAEIDAPKYGPRSWRLYGRPDICGTSRSHYAAQRDVRKALRMLSSDTRHSADGLTPSARSDSI